MIMRSLLLCIIILCAHVVKAQDSTVVTLQTWSDLTTIHEFNEKWIYSGDYGIRGALSNEDWTTFYARPTFRYNASLKLNVRAGVSVFYTAEELLESQTELRFHQQVNLTWPNFSDWILKHMIRFEERFFYYKALDNDFSARARYRIALETPDVKVFGIKNSFYGLTSFELFAPLGVQSVEQYINNNRIVVGIGHRAGLKLKFELHYIFQNSKNYKEENFQTSEHILRLRTFLITKRADPVEP